MSTTHFGFQTVDERENRLATPPEPLRVAKEIGDHLRNALR